MQHESTESARRSPSSASSLAFILIATFGILFVGPPLFQAALEWRDDGSIQAFDLFRRRPRATALRAFEEELEKRSWLRQRVGPDYARSVDRVFARGNDKVVMGSDGWLFYRDGIRYVAGPSIAGAPPQGPTSSVSALDVVLDMHRQLAEREIVLVVVPVPTKATLYPERLPAASRADPTPSNPGREGFLARLRDAGVVVVDAQAALVEAKRSNTQVFLERDTHWTKVGMQVVASAVAERVREIPGFGQLAIDAQEFDYRFVGFHGAGDVTGMLAYTDRHPSDSARPDWPDMRFTLDQVIATRDGRAPTGDRRSPILVVGDSLAGVFSDSRLGLGRRGGFAEHLAAALKLPLDVVAIPGGGLTAAWRSVSLRPSGLYGKHIVVWEFTERDLRFSREGWQLQELPPPNDEVQIEELPPSRIFSALGRVDDVSDVPTTLDYDDCLMFVKYAAIEVDKESQIRRFFYVAHWGWRDGERTSAVHFERRQRHAMRLVPLRERHDLESTCWIDTVGLEGEPWWAESLEVVP